MSRTIVSPAVQLERDQILEDEWIWAETYGDEITVYLNSESSVVRDPYNSLQQENTKISPAVLILRAYPIVFNPNKWQLEKAGIQEQVNVIVTIPMKYWILVGYDINDLNGIKGSVSLRQEMYTITDKSLQRQMADTFASMNVGLFKK